MTIETMYNIGDKVWFQTLGINYKAKIIHIYIDVFPVGTTSYITTSIVMVIPMRGRGGTFPHQRRTIKEFVV